MEFSNDGLTLWCDTADAPLSGEGLTVGVRPAHPANAVTVHRRVDGRPASPLRATVLASPRPGRDQYFRAGFPTCPDGSVVELLPVLTCAGRQTPLMDRDGTSPSTWLRHVYESPPPAPTLVGRPPSEASPRFTAALEYLAQVSVKLIKPAEDLGVVPAGLRRNFYIGGGACRGKRLNADVLAEGLDSMTIQRDGVALPGIRTTWKTAEGALLFGEYSGVFDLGNSGFEKSLRGVYPTRPAIYLAPRIVTSHPKYAWLNRLQLLGIGSVDFDQLLVEYDLYAVTGGLPVLHSGTERQHG